MQASTDLARRIRAARELAGLSSAGALAEAIDEAGLSERTIYKIEQGKRGIEDSEAYVIARACGVDPSFFKADLSRPLDAPQGDAVLRKLHELEARLVLIDGKLDGNHDAIQALKLLGEAADPGGHDASTERVPRPASRDRVQANRPPARRSQ